MSTSRALISELSFKTENKLLKYTLIKLGRMRSQLVMFAVFSLLSYPLLAIGALTSFNDSSSSFMALSAVICVLSIFGIVILTISMPIGCFDYFSRKTVVDMNYSLPITNRQRFWGDFLTSIIPISVMHLLSIGTGLLIMFLGRKLFYITWAAEKIEAAKEQYSEMLSQAFQLALIGFLVLLGVYILTVFACTVSGRAFENWLTLMMIMVFVPSVVALCVVMPFVNVTQMNISNYLIEITAPISPVMFLINSIVAMEITDANLLLAANPLPYIIFLALITAISYFLGTRRNVERVGEAFAHKPTSSILLGSLLFTITSLFCIAINQTYNDNDKFSLAITMVILTLIAFMIFELLTKRSFRRLHIGFIKYAGMVGGTVIISAMLFQADGFGIGRYVPEPEKVESINVNYLQSYGMSEYIGMGGYDSYVWNAEFTEPETIETIIKLNKESNNLSSVYNGNSFTAKYKLNDGREIERNIIYTEEYNDDILALSMSKEVKQKKIDSFRNFLKGYTHEINVKLKNAYAKDLFGENIVSLSNLDLDAIFEAYSKDIMAQTIEQVYENPKQPLYILEFRVEYEYENTAHMNGTSERTTQIYVLPHFENLKAVLKNYISDADIPKTNFNNKNINLMYEMYDEKQFVLDSGYLISVQLEDIANNTEYQRLIEAATPVRDERYPKYFILDCENILLYIPNKYFDDALKIFEELYENQQ